MSETNIPKAQVFNTVLQWLRDSEYTITSVNRNPEKNEYFAKVFPPGEKVKFFEIVSNSDFKEEFLFRFSMSFTPEDKKYFEGLKEDVVQEYFIRIHTALAPYNLFCRNHNSVTIVQKIMFIDTKSILGKQYFWDTLTDIFNAMYFVELTYHKFLNDILPDRNH